MGREATQDRSIRFNVMNPDDAIAAADEDVAALRGDGGDVGRGCVDHPPDDAGTARRLQRARTLRVGEAELLPVVLLGRRFSRTGGRRLRGTAGLPRRVFQPLQDAGMRLDAPAAGGRQQQQAAVGQPEHPLAGPGIPAMEDQAQPRVHQPQDRVMGRVIGRIIVIFEVSDASALHIPPSLVGIPFGHMRHGHQMVPGGAEDRRCADAHPDEPGRLVGREVPLDQENHRVLILIGMDVIRIGDVAVGMPAARRNWTRPSGT